MVVIRLYCLSPAYLSKPSLICDFCPSDQGFAYSFLQIPPHDGHPCCSTIHFPLPGHVQDFHLRERAHGAQTKRAPLGAQRHKKKPDSRFYLLSDSFFHLSIFLFYANILLYFTIPASSYQIPLSLTHPNPNRLYNTYLT